jgi:hypothetical protein
VSTKSARVVFVIMGCAALTLTGCGHAVQTNGTVTGKASPCIGPLPTRFNPDTFRYTVSLYRGTRMVAQQRLTGDTSTTYRFTVPSGHYQVRNYPGTVDVTVRAGLTTHADLFEPCG